MRRGWYVFALICLSILAIAVNATYPTITNNNRFVIYIVIVCVNIAALVYLYMTSQKLLRNLLLAILGMSAFAFLLVPLYNVFCDVTGLNGKVDLSVASPNNIQIDFTRKVVVEFVVSQNLQMPWDFRPKHHTIVVHPGELATTAYFAKNRSDHSMYAQAIPSITPAIARKYFKKVECFCFSKQKLGPGETAYLGLRFYLDPAIPKDISRVTLAYTIFDITNLEQ